MDQRYSLRELELLANHGIATIPLGLIFARRSGDPTHLLQLTEQALDTITDDLVKTRQHIQESGEDQLTVSIVNSLRYMTFNAYHDADYGGHCDIVIEEGRFLWIGEAKEHSSYDWLLKGFQQLDTRYATGLPKQDTGGLMIYCFGAQAKTVLKKWQEHLVEKRPDVTISHSKELEFTSEHIHQGSERLFKVRHTIVPLHFKPMDK